MPQEQISIFDEDTSSIQVKRSNVRRKAMIFPNKEASELVKKIQTEMQSESGNPQGSSETQQSTQEKYAA